MLYVAISAGSFTCQVQSAEKVTVLLAYTTGARQFVEEYPNVFKDKPTTEVLVKALAEMNLALTNSSVTSFSMAFAKAPFEVT